jgi:hypothetical protein
MAPNPASYNNIQKIIDQALRDFHRDIDLDDPPIGITDTMYVYHALVKAEVFCKNHPYDCLCDS